MKQLLLDNRRFVATLLFGVILSLTPYYTFGVLLVIVLLAVYTPLYRSGYFHPVSTRLVATFLLYSAWLMTIATYCWTAHITLHPAFYLIGFTLAYLIVYRLIKPATAPSLAQKTAPSRMHSGLSVALSMLGVAIIGLSFYSSNPTLSSSVQIMTNGYDNSAHLSMIQTTYEANGYVYGPYDQIKDQIAWKTLTAYPQGWHFVNAYMWKGTGLQFFTANSAPLDVNFYILTIFGWYTMALFLFHQLLWSISAKVLSKRLTLIETVAFILLSLLIQLLVFWGSLQFGFATFIGALAFTFLATALMLNAPSRIQTKAEVPAFLVSLVVATLLIAAVAQGWLFASPVIGVSLLVVYLPLVVKSIKSKLLSLKQIVATLFFGAVAFLPIIIQLFINMKFSTQGTNQINDDGGIFGISTTLAAVTIALTVTLLPKFSKDKKLTTKLFSVIAAPIGFTWLLFAYQLFTIGHPAYFFTKLLAFTLCIVWIPLTYIVFNATNSLKKDVGGLGAIISMATWFLLMPLMLGQNIDSFTKLLQRNSNLTTQAATNVATTLENGTVRYKKTFVFTGQNINGDTIGTIFTTTLGETKSRCDGVGWLISKGEYEKLPQFINTCANTEQIQLITSSEMSKDILNKLDSRINAIQ